MIMQGHKYNCGYPVRDEEHIVYTTKPCNDPAVDYIDIRVEDDGTYRIHICEHHYYMALKLQDWQAAQMLREGRFVTEKLKE